MYNLIAKIVTLSDQPTSAIEPGTELIESGIIDSMNIAKLLAYIEDRTGRSIPLEELDLDQIKTPAAIMDAYLASETV
ncbi:phosphopantetheine-binding protein [Fulvimarina sp. MAC8]|uniref:phosphopantetheine-binding protein n=1 Tax=Fulvimarina sp. MAC8 TaxID=3162874 RepID=UPI0032EACF02